MAIYFSSEQVMISFRRLSSRKSKGKTPMERTSSLMYFLAFDAAIKKKTGKPHLDLNPETNDGKDNRKLIELEFTRLVLLERNKDEIIQVAELGKITNEGRAPEKRISSNFLTVPLKKASEQTKPYYYPNRPAAPLIKMGKAATGSNWGMERHEKWSENLPKLFSEIKEPTVFTDLAIFVMRDSSLSKNHDNCLEALSKVLFERFTNELSSYWIEKIKKEKVLAKHTMKPFSDRHESFVKQIKALEELPVNTIESLKKHIKYLETLLNKNKINFNQLT